MPAVPAGCFRADPGGRYPEYSDQIIAAAKASFLAGDSPAYACGIVIVLLGAVLVYCCFPKRDREQQLLAAYADEDTRSAGRVVGE